MSDLDVDPLGEARVLDVLAGQGSTAAMSKMVACSPGFAPQSR